MQRLGLIGGIGLATLGTLGVAGSGILWNFQGRTLGLGATITSLVILSIGVVLLRPLPQESSFVEPEESPGQSEQSSAKGFSIQRPQASLIGFTLATVGTLTLAGSGILWNFKGIAFGLTGTITALVALLLSLPFLWPIGGKRPKSSTPVVRKSSVASGSRPVPSKPVQQSVALPNDQESSVDQQDETSNDAPLTTAEAIAAELAAAQESAPPVKLVNFAPDHLLPGQTLPTRTRRPGASIQNGYKGMVEELFRS